MPSGDTSATCEQAAAGDDGTHRGLPETIGGYRLVRRLGGGGMGSVYEAEEAASGRRVALKLVLPELGGSGDALVRFRQEGRLASSVSHPRCVFVLAADEDAGRPYIVMELMPGATLADLVRDKGPLPVEEAVAKILDVIDGLIEAHRLGLVHRDVKPSNCFVESGGRVKIGDFGLARSLASDSKLTRTGSFVGTPLYAAPEQIHKKDPIDAQSDVYSVAATLYFLLTGRAPFEEEGSDAIATMARIIADDAPPLRSVRPQLPRALDRVVLRGLQRDRRRRYRDLEEMRRALVPFLPATPSVGGLGLRFAAWLVDVLLSLGAARVILLGIGAAGLLASPLARALVKHGVGAVLDLGYFGVLEGLAGWSLGKRLLRLRVGAAGSNRPPGVLRATVRIGTLVVLFGMSSYVFEAFLFLGLISQSYPGMPQEEALKMVLAGCGSALWKILAIVLVLVTMRPRNGYRGLHEFLSGTRTYQLRWPQPRDRRLQQRRTFELEVTRPAELPQGIGGFAIQGAIAWRHDERILLAQDEQLDRPIWLWLRPASLAPLSAAWRDISRATRPRWVAAGTLDGWQWDAFIAPAGMPLPLLAAGQPRLSWAEVRPMLEDLTEEVEAACTDATLPNSLTPDQVWVQRSGRVQLVGMHASANVVTPTDAAMKEMDDEQRALRFLGELAVMALEGAPRPIKSDGDAVRAPLPPYAGELLQRLLGGRTAYRCVAELRQDLDTLRDRPAEISRWRRASHLAVSLVVMHVPICGPAPALLLWLSFLPLFIGVRHPDARDKDVLLLGGYVALCCLFWVAWAFVFRGGYMYWRGGIALRRADGRKASRLQCGLRALLVWGPPCLLYSAAIALSYYVPESPWLYFGLWGTGTLLLMSHPMLALLYPARSLHDRIVGTYPVPA